MRIRVLDLRDTYEVGGPGKTILETFRFIDHDRFDLHLGVFLIDGESPDSPFLSAARQYGMPVHLIRGSNRYDPRLVTGTAALVRAVDAHIAHAHEVKSDIVAYAASFLCRTRLVTTMHGWIANSGRQRALVNLDKRVARRYDKVIAVSARIQQELNEAGVPDARVRLIHNAIVPERYERTGSKGLVGRLFGREPGSPVLVCIGRLSAEKGHADFLAALGLLRQGGRDVAAVLAGDGPERPRLERQIADLGLHETVRLAGHLERPQDLLEEADLMVLPSHTEGLPNAALEALVMDVPVLATRVGGTPDVIDDGETGRLVPARDPASLAAAIEDFLGNQSRWSEMAQRGHARVVQRFDFRARTRAVESLYREMMEQP